MPYKIYTYTDPYKLDKTDFWEEISILPHFCSARTLVNGLISVLHDNIKSLICPLDMLVEHDEMYKRWTDNIGLRIQQYSVLSTIFNNMLKNKQIDDKFHKSLSENQSHFLDAIRLFIELGISASSIDETKGSKEQKIFVSVLKDVQNSALFSFPPTPELNKIKDIIIDLAEKELHDCKRKNELNRCRDAVKLTKEKTFNAIVIHGVHQFSPAQLRLITSLDKMGITIIFLFNYQKKYSKMYSSWLDIYGCFDVPIREDSIIKEYKIPTMQNQSNSLACALGSLCENERNLSDNLLMKYYELYKNIDLIEFDNISEYAHYVSNHYDEACSKYAKNRSILERGNDVWNYSEVLRYLDEQIYTSNRDIHTLLKIYYPEHSKDRHFLSYPIGQFFSAIYRLWDYKKGEIIFDIDLIKECISSNVLKAAPGEVLLRTFYNVEILFKNISTYSDFKKIVSEKYINNYYSIVGSNATNQISSLKQLSIYNKYKVKKHDICSLINAIDEINSIAKYFFALDDSKEDYINFGLHFHKIEEFLKRREMSLANEQERQLITELQCRLDTIKPEENTFSGTFKDLKEGLYFYLKQKNDESTEVDWIVKNFEQIDGDILQSKNQFDLDINKTYHFACLSDKDMNISLNEQLPWPLTDEFIRSSYSPVDLQFQVYYTALGERSQFLRYALFYGLFYNRCNVRLSYVKQYNDETTEPYVLLSILGIKTLSGFIESSKAKSDCSIVINKEPVNDLQYDNMQMMDMLLCPYRFFLDYIMEDSPIINGEFLYQKFYENILIDAVWQKIQGKSKENALKNLSCILNQESDKLKPYVCFWKDTEIFDLIHRAYNYIKYEIIDNGRGLLVENYSSEHMKVRKLFGAAKFNIDISDIEYVNPYEFFESLSIKKYPKKEYSLYKIPKRLDSSKTVELKNKLLMDAKCYLNHSKFNDKTAIPSDWCMYCVHKSICMQPYIAKD